MDSCAISTGKSRASTFPAASQLIPSQSMTAAQLRGPTSRILSAQVCTLPRQDRNINVNGSNSSTYPRDINDNGLVVGTYSNNLTIPPLFAFLRHPDGGIATFSVPGNLPPPPSRTLMSWCRLASTTREKLRDILVAMAVQGGLFGRRTELPSLGPPRTPPRTPSMMPEPSPARPIWRSVWLCAVSERRDHPVQRSSGWDCLYPKRTRPDRPVGRNRWRVLRAVQHSNQRLSAVAHGKESAFSLRCTGHLAHRNQPFWYRPEPTPSRMASCEAFYAFHAFGSFAGSFR